METISSGPGLAVLVTRPEGQADKLIRALEQRGHRVWHQPLLELEPAGELTASQRRHLAELDGYSQVIFVSANAVRYGMERITDYWPQLPVGPGWCAVGDATAALLATYDVPVTAPVDQMTSEGLLRLEALQDVEGRRILIVRGEGGRTLLQEELSRRGARVDELGCYRRKRPPLPPGAMARLLEASGIQVILISSGEGLENLQALLSPQESTKFRHIGLLVPSQRVADQAAAAGFDRVLVADNASDAAMLRALEAFTPGSGE